MHFVFQIVVKVLKDIYVYIFSGAWSRNGLDWEGFFSYFSYCVYFLFKKKLLCLEKLVTLIFSTWQVSVM